MSKSFALPYLLTYEDAIEVLRAVRDSEFCESMTLEIDDMKLSVTRRLDSAPAPGAPRPSIAVAAIGSSSSVVQAQPDAPALTADDGLVAIVAPMLGMFYRAPSPGEPPCVKEGDVIGADHTIGLVEVMKLFTSIPAGVAGRVVKVLAEDATLVEYHQPLVLVEPC
jgi:acetyl-CoA carboxylase biotin carboxyl carrier protein